MAYLLVMAGVLPLAAHAQAPPVPELTGRVVDKADLLSPSTEQLLTDRLRAHEDSTGNQVAVLTVASLNGAVLEEYSLEVARAWALGQEAFDNGALLLVAHEDRDVRIEVGYGLEGDLPDVVASRIIRNEIVPAFRDGDFDGGVRAGVEAILGALEGTYSPPAPSSPGNPSSLRDYLFLLFTLVFAGGVAGAISLGILGFTARGGWPLWLFSIFFLLPFVAAAWPAAFASLAALLLPTVSIPLVLLLTLTALVALIGYSIWLLCHPTLRTLREKAKADEPIDQTVTVGFLTLPPAFWTSDRKLEVFGRTVVLSKGSSSHSSLGDSTFSGSSGGFSSDSGFSGGGGSFGGGGASGSW